jgi:hypothetical protein
MRYYKQTLIGAFTVVFFLGCFWIIGIGLAWPDTSPMIPWAVDGPIGIYLEDPYQTKAAIEEGRMGQWQAQRFFSTPQRDPFQQLVYRRETI